MKKILFAATVDSHIQSFHLPYLEWFYNNGYEVHVASNGSNQIPNTHVKHNVPFERSPFKRNNIKAYKQLSEIVNSNHFELIHCHTPMGGALTRLAARSQRKKGAKVFYTAHGFHFFKGAPFINWLIYYPVEKWMANYTDCLITINEEDYKFGRKFSTNVVYVPGVGIDTNQIRKKSINKTIKREELGIPEDSIMVVSVGELNTNKNHIKIIKALGELNDKNVYYVICGQGELLNYLKEQANILGIDENVRFVGYRKDVLDILKAADIFCFPSYREGLPLSVMEAMAVGLPCIVSKIRGNVDLIIENKGGYYINPECIDDIRMSLETLVHNSELREKMGNYNSKTVESFSLVNVEKCMKSLYQSYL